MTKKRKNDSQNTPERIERTFHIDVLWYFELRGGGQRGPFESKQEMEEALREFIDLQQDIKSKDNSSHSGR